jgi:hypothetical protein
MHGRKRRHTTSASYSVVLLYKQDVLFHRWAFQVFRSTDPD